MRSNLRIKEASGTLTEAARRTQLVDAAITVLANRGFASTSLAAIADHVGVSKGVISYHFVGKAELLQEVVRAVLRRAGEWMAPRVQNAPSYTAALRLYITSNIAYLDAHREEVVALTEVLANARATPGVDDLFSRSHEDAVLALESLFRDGIEAKEFSPLPARTAAIALRAAIDAGSTSLRADPDFAMISFGEELAALWERTVAA